MKNSTKTKKKHYHQEATEAVNLVELGAYLHLSIDDILFDNKFQYLGSGYNRTVLDLRNGYVLKITEDGMTRNNEVEWKVWCESPEALRKILTPCYLDLKNAQKLFMHKAEPVSFEDLHSFLTEREGAEGAEEMLEALHLLSVTYNLHYADLIADASWGIVNGKCKLIDYGCYAEE